MVSPLICEYILGFAFERPVDQHLLGTGRQAYVPSCMCGNWGRIEG
jgi:hypothetical protein